MTTCISQETKKKRRFREVHLSFALRQRFSNIFEQAAFPSEFLSDVRTYVAPVMMHTGI